MRQKRQDQADPGELLEKELTGAIIGAFYETYNILDFGFLESVYKNSLACELRDRGFRVRREVPVRVIYKKHRVGWHRIDPPRRRTSRHRSQGDGPAWANGQTPTHELPQSNALGRWAAAALRARARSASPSLSALLPRTEIK